MLPLPRQSQLLNKKSKIFHRLSQRAIDKISEPVRSPGEMSGDGEYDEEALARFADSIYTRE